MIHLNNSRIFSTAANENMKTQIISENNQTLFQGRQHPFSPKNYPGRLLITSQDDFGKEFLLNRQDNSIGRSRRCSVRISDQAASGYHALISRRNGEFILKDMNSKNGTFINDRSLSGFRPMKTGDEIRVGKTVFVFVDKDASFSKDDFLGKPLTAKALPAFRQGRRFFSSSLLFLVVLFVTACLSFIGLSDKIASALDGEENLISPAYVTHKILEAPPEELFDTVVKKQADGEVASEKEDSKKAESGEDLLAESLKKYVEGNVEKALEKLRKARKENNPASPDVEIDLLIQNISQTCDLFKKGLKAYDMRRYDSAFEIWKAAIILDTRIIGSKKSFYSDQISGYIAEEYSRRAQRAYKKKDYSTAKKHCAVALEAVPEYSAAVKIREMIKTDGK